MASGSMQSYTVQRAMIYSEKIWLWSLHCAGVEIDFLSDSYMKIVEYLKSETRHMRIFKKK